MLGIALLCCLLILPVTSSLLYVKLKWTNIFFTYLLTLICVIGSPYILIAVDQYLHPAVDVRCGTPETVLMTGTLFFITPISMFLQYLSNLYLVDDN